MIFQVCAASRFVAILFMEWIEKKALTQFARCLIFLRYVDHCYAWVRSAEEAKELQDCLNAQHHTINFELEECTKRETTTILNVLDLIVNISDNLGNLEP